MAFELRCASRKQPSPLSGKASGGSQPQPNIRNWGVHPEPAEIPSQIAAPATRPNGADVLKPTSAAGLSGSPRDFLHDHSLFFHDPRPCRLLSPCDSESCLVSARIFDCRACLGAAHAILPRPTCPNRSLSHFFAMVRRPRPRTISARLMALVVILPLAISIAG